MSEPTWRTRSGLAAVFRLSALRLHSPLTNTLSLCAAFSVLGLGAMPLQAEESAASDPLYAIESPKAVQSLLLDIAHAGPRLVAVGDRGHILYSNDDGKTWQQARVPTRQMLTAVFFLDDQHGWAVGHDAQILVTADGGQSWTLQFEDLHREAPLLDIWFENADHGMAVGAYGALLETEDGGKSWNDVSDRIDNEDGYHLNAIAAVKDSGLFIVGEAGSMFRSADWGQTWEKLEGPYEGSLFGALGTAEPNSLVVYGLRGHLFRSADFGDTWERVELKTASGGTLEFGLSSGSLLGDGSLVVVGHGGSVLKSSDDGRSFSVFNRPDRISLAAATAGANGELILAGQGGVRVSSPTGAVLVEKQ
jgi:photosystem II stability/assembly factor-like uncharacterized protein